MSPDDLERLAIVMARHGITHYADGGIVIDRPAGSAPAPEKTAKNESPLERLKRMGVDEQDNELRLRRLP